MRRGAELGYFLRSARASSHSVVQVKLLLLFPLSAGKKAWHLSNDRLMNLFSVAAIPVNFWISFRVVGSLSCSTVTIWFGSASIPLLVT